jgi:hypothetical protein
MELFLWDQTYEDLESEITFCGRTYKKLDVFTGMSNSILLLHKQNSGITRRFCDYDSINIKQITTSLGGKKTSLTSSETLILAGYFEKDDIKKLLIKTRLKHICTIKKPGHACALIYMPQRQPNGKTEDTWIFYDPNRGSIGSCDIETAADEIIKSLGKSLNITYKFFSDESAKADLANIKADCANSLAYYKRIKPEQLIQGDGLYMLSFTSKLPEILHTLFENAKTDKKLQDFIADLMISKNEYDIVAAENINEYRWHRLPTWLKQLTNNRGECKKTFEDFLTASSMPKPDQTSLMSKLSQSFGYNQTVCERLLLATLEKTDTSPKTRSAICEWCGQNYHKLLNVDLLYKVTDVVFNAGKPLDIPFPIQHSLERTMKLSDEKSDIHKNALDLASKYKEYYSKVRSEKTESSCKFISQILSTANNKFWQSQTPKKNKIPAGILQMRKLINEGCNALGDLKKIAEDRMKIHNGKSEFTKAFYDSVYYADSYDMDKMLISEIRLRRDEISELKCQNSSMTK